MREVRGTRYRKACNGWMEEFIVKKLRFFDYDQTIKFYKALVANAVKVGLNRDIFAFLGCNDRYFLLTHILNRKDALHPWIFNRCREVEANPDGYIDLWARFHYKAVDMRALVPTPTGWRPHGSLNPGDEVFGPDGKPTKVIAKTPAFTDADCWLVRFDKGYEVVVSGDHLWTVETASRRRVCGGRDGRQTVTINTRDLADEVWRSQTVPSRVMPSVQVSAPLEYQGSDLPVPPYVLGAWLGDGSSADGRITIDEGDEEILEHIRSFGYRVERKQRKLAQIYGLRPQLRSLGVSPHKHIPRSYLEASVGYRWALLRGLMDTDGHCDTRGTATFVNKSEILAANVFELAVSLGLKPSMRRVSGAFNGAPYPYFQISFQARADSDMVFGLARKAARSTKGVATRSRRHSIVSVERVPTIPVSCIQVERQDGQYLIGEHCITTHNSTIITFAGVIQEMLCDPEITIAIFSVTQRTAQKFLSQIKVELEGNENLISLYRDVLWTKPKTQAPTWGAAGGLTLRRVGNPKEATLEAHGLIDGQPTGRHFRLHIYDDVVTQDYMSSDMIEKTTLRWEMADNLGDTDGARKWVAGTRYNFADTYGVMMQRGSFIPRIYPATHDGKIDGKPVFLSEERWTQIKRDQQQTLSAQMLLNPAYGTDATFDPTWLKTYQVIPAVMNVYIMCDPSLGRGVRSDRSAIAVIGIDPAGNKYFLDGVRHRMKLSDRWTYLSQLYHKWLRHEGVLMCKVGYEKYGMQTDLEVIDEYQRRDNDIFKIEELNTPNVGPHSKSDRIGRLEPDIRNGTFYLPAVVYHADFREVSHGRGIWKPWTDDDDQRKDKTEEEGSYKVGQIVYRPLLGLTNLQRKVSQKRIVHPIRRIDESNKVYDVTRSLLQEIMEHPFGQYKDLIDAASRIYDMTPLAPAMHENINMEAVDDEFNPETLNSDGVMEDDLMGSDASFH